MPRYNIQISLDLKKPEDFLSSEEIDSLEKEVPDKCKEYNVGLISNVRSERQPYRKSDKMSFTIGFRIRGKDENAKQLHQYYRSEGYFCRIEKK
jgi:hypothetical protein